MKLRLKFPKDRKHTVLVPALGWSAADELISAGDDGKILKWNIVDGDCQPLLKLPDDVYPTCLDFLPVVSGSGPGIVDARGATRAGGSELFALGSADGKVHFISRGGRVERSIEAHQGAVTCICWSGDATTVLTAGEDGSVKIWSRGGMLRSTVMQNSLPIYSACWSADSDQVLCAVDRSLMIKPLQGASKPTQWRAHEGLIMHVDWHSATGLILSGGEDCLYKIWDSYGRALYVSQPLPSPVTALKWSGDGSIFAVGSFNWIRLCDRVGWSHSVDKLSGVGNILSIRWSPDGTQLAAGCGSGQVITATAVGRILEWRHLEASIADTKVAIVRDVLNGSTEHLETRDRIVQSSLAYGQLVLVTLGQCYIYSSRNWNTPIIFELKEGSVALIVQAERYFCLAEGAGLYIYSYDGRLVASPRAPPGTRTDQLSRQLVSMSSTTLALRDRVDKRIVHVFEAQSGKPVLGVDGKPFAHTLDILAIGLDQANQPTDQRLAFIDRNSDLYIAPLRGAGTQQRRVFKLSTVTHSLCWHDELPILATQCEGRFVLWCYPSVVLADPELLPFTTISIDSSAYGREPSLAGFSGGRLNIRQTDGAMVVALVDPYPIQLHTAVLADRWDDAVRLCRFSKNRVLWACLAGMAGYARKLQAAEVAYAAIDKIDRVKHLRYIRELPSKDLQKAEMALFCGNLMEAESIILQAGLVFRAILMNIELYAWDRALDIAVKHKQHIDVVLAYRQKYLENFGRKENNKKFLQTSLPDNADPTSLDWDKIQAKVEAELKRERGSVQQQSQPPSATSQAYGTQPSSGGYNR